MKDMKAKEVQRLANFEVLYCVYRPIPEVVGLFGEMHRTTHRKYTVGAGSSSSKIELIIWRIMNRIRALASWNIFIMI